VQKHQSKSEGLDNRRSYLASKVGWLEPTGPIGVYAYDPVRDPKAQTRLFRFVADLLYKNPQQIEVMEFGLKTLSKARDVNVNCFQREALRAGRVGDLFVDLKPA